MQLSIIVPMYNSEKYISECINSIINQKFKDFELLLINDGSTDRTEDICKLYLSKDSRIRLFNQENAGVGMARNLGIIHAQGKYIGFVDSDDYIDEFMFEKLFDIVHQFKVDIAICKRIIPNSKTNYGHSYPIKRVFYFNEKSQNWKKDFYNGDLETFVTNKIFKSSLLKNRVKFLRYPVLEDRIFMEELFVLNPSMYYLNEPLYFYRTVQNSSLRKYYKNRYEIIIKTFNNELKLNNLYDNNFYYINILKTFSNSIFNCVLQEANNKEKDRVIVFEQIANSKEFNEIKDNFDEINLKKAKRDMLVLLANKNYKQINILLKRKKIINKIKKIMRGKYEKIRDYYNT